MTAITPETYDGKDAKVWIGLKGESTSEHDALAIGEMSITIDRGTVDRGLLGETGNYHTQGAVSITGSVTAAKLSDDTAALFLESIANGTSDYRITISGQYGSKSLHFDFDECMVTSSSIDVGDASTISDGSFDFQVMNPSQLSKTYADDGVKIEC